MQARKTKTGIMPVQSYLYFDLMICVVYPYFFHSFYNCDYLFSLITRMFFFLNHKENKMKLDFVLLPANKDFVSDIFTLADELLLTVFNFGDFKAKLCFC